MSSSETPYIGRARWFAVAVLALVSGACGPSMSELAVRYPVVPHPAELEPRDGFFELDAGTRILLSDVGDPALDGLARRHLAEPLRRAAGLPLPVAGLPGSGSVRNVVVLRLRTGNGGADGDDGASATVPASVTGEIPAGRGPTAEAYTLSVSEERIELAAGTHAGLFRGLQTLRQLLPPEVDRAVRELAAWNEQAPEPAGERAGGPGDGAAPERVTDREAERAGEHAGAHASELPVRVPRVEIRDAPRFAWRGMHLDVGRHFFSVEFVKKYIDLLALHRMNTFHWHLTEDQGWRIDIQRYPRLARVGGCRAETMVEKNWEPFVGDGTRYCGYYTQDEIREVVAYAAERHVTVIPEIEMPGHSRAALAAYPELACTEGPFEVATRWGVFEDIFCPGEATFTFLENVLTEVMELFPSRYIHIGGDEAPKARWEASPVAQEIIRREGLADEAELQSWFIRRIQAFLADHGRRLVGWDEILEGGLAPDATVMSWRGMGGGIEAAEQGHDVVMTPTSHVYFDYYQGPEEDEPLAIGGFTPLDSVYAFEPVPAELDGERARHVLGGQGNVWTEYMKTPGHVEYMALPRMAALAEVLWSPRDLRNRESFRARLEAHLPRLDALDVDYRPPGGGGER